MKKLLALLLTLVFALSLVACGTPASNDNDDDSTSSASSVVDSVNQDIVDLISTQQSTIDSIKDQYAGTLDFAMEARGNSLVYKYSYLSDLGDLSLLKTSLDSSLESGAETFESSLKTMQLAVPGMESLIIEYYDMNGTLITSREYK